MKKLCTFVFLLLTCGLSAKNDKELILRSNNAIQQFIAAQENDLLLSYDSMQAIFSDSMMSYEKLRSAIRSDVAACKRYIRNHVQDCDYARYLLHKLQLLYRYVKQYKECCKALHFHQQLQARYRNAFRNEELAISVQLQPEQYGVGSAKYRSRAYFKKICRDLKEIERFEDTLHGDHGVLKAHNHVYKIELINIRNYIYHNNRYKFETRYF